MAQVNITLDLEELTEAIFESDMNAMMKSMAVAVLNAYMEIERDHYINATPYERTHKRKDQRNGYYERDYTLNVGTVKLKVPRTRTGEFSTDIFEKYQRMDKAFVLAMVEMVVNGVSTRKVSNIVEKLCGEDVSKSFVSGVLKELDPVIDEFKSRSLTHSKFRYVYADAMYIKVREIIGFRVSDEESEEAWTNFFRDMTNRGLRRPKLIISDAHAGLKAAIRKVFVGTTWQRCTFHFTKNIADTMPKKNSEVERQMVKDILRAPTKQNARELKVTFEEHVINKPKYEKALQTLDSGFEDAIQYMGEPEAYHISLRTTNSVERINREIRRRDKVIGIYPNIPSAERLIGAVVMDLHEEWQSKKYKFLKDRNL